jgi:RimJ/RimL family protein N-acetyltransferase
LQGSLVTLRPLKDEDFEALYAAASDPLIWEQHPNSDRYQREVFRKFFQDAIDSNGGYLILDARTQKVIGSSRYYDYEPEKKKVVIGYTFLTRDTWGQGHNREVKRLMILHAYTFADQVHFHVDERNLRSQKAMEKIGGRQVDRFQKTSSSGNLRTTLVYELTKDTALRL